MTNSLNNHLQKQVLYANILDMTREVLAAIFPRKQIICIVFMLALFAVIGVSVAVFGDFFHNLFYRPDRTFEAPGSPTGNTYGYWGVGHILMIVLTIVAFIAVGIFCYKKKHLVNIAYIIATVGVAVCAAGLLAYSIVTGRWNMEWYIPVHICNFFLILYPLTLIFKNKFRRFFMDYTVVAGIVGCVLATVFPMTTLIYYPAWHIVPILCWLHHVFLGLLGIYLITSGVYNRFSWFKLMSVIWVLVGAAVAVNYFLGTNFIFMNYAYINPPISWFTIIFGQHAVLIMIMLFTFATVALQIVLDFYHYIKRFTIRDIVLWIRVQIEKVRYDIDPNSIKKLKDRNIDLFKFLTEAEIRFFMDTPIELLSDPSYLYSNLQQLGTFKRFVNFAKNFRATRRQKLRYKLIGATTS